VAKEYRKFFIASKPFWSYLYLRSITKRPSLTNSTELYEKDTVNKLCSAVRKLLYEFRIKGSFKIETVTSNISTPQIKSLKAIYEWGLSNVSS